MSKVFFIILIIILVVIVGSVLVQQYFFENTDKQEPEIVVVFPNGEDLIIGELQTIRWQLKDNDLIPSEDAYINIFLQKEDMMESSQEVLGRLNESQVLASSGKFVWDGSSYFIETQSGGRTEYKVKNGERYKIKIIYIWDTESQPVKSVKGLSDEYFNVKVTDETSDWQIYSNQDVGYELKYPNDWSFRTNGGTIIDFCPTVEAPCQGGKGNYSQTISLTSINLDRFHPDFCVENTNNIFCVWEFNELDIQVGGRNGRLYKLATGERAYAAWKKEDSDQSVYDMFVNKLDVYPENEEIFNQMLSTFKFIE